MKKLLIIILILALIIPLVSCNEQDKQNDKLDINMPTAEPDDGTIINLDKQFDDSTNLSYITYKAGYRTRPYFINNAEFPENIFIYETNTPHTDDIKMYGYMNENFQKLSEPISLSPNVFTMGVAMIEGEEGSYIVNKDFENMVELCSGYALVDNGIVKVSWGSESPEHVTVLTITDPDIYLVPVKVDTGLISDKGKVYIYGYQPVTEFLSGSASYDEIFSIQPVFEDARPFFNGLAAVRSNGMWGYIDEDGNTVIDFIYHEARDFIETSTFVLQGEMRTVYYSETRSEKVLEGYWFLIDSEGNPLTPTNAFIEYADDFYDGWALVKYGMGVTPNQNYLNINGEELMDKINYNYNLEPFKDGIAIQHHGDYRFINVKGEFLFNTHFWNARNFNDGLAAVKAYRSRSWTYIDSSGMIAIDGKFFSAGDFNNGYAFVIDEIGKKGFVIDKLGNKYLDDLNIYQMTKFNDEGYALAYTIVDKNETTQEWLYYMIHVENLP